MANEIICSFEPSATLFAVVRESPDGGKVWNVTDSTWDNWDIADLAKDKITMTENGIAGMCYVGSFPTSITVQDRYFVQILNAVDNEVEKDGWIDWSGIQEQLIPVRKNIR